MHHRSFIIILPRSLEDQRQRTETSLPSDAASIAAGANAAVLADAAVALGAAVAGGMCADFA